MNAYHHWEFPILPLQRKLFDHRAAEFCLMFQLFWGILIVFPSFINVFHYLIFQWVHTKNLWKKVPIYIYIYIHTNTLSSIKLHQTNFIMQLWMGFKCLKAAKPLCRAQFSFYQLSSQEVLVIIWLTWSRWKGESTLKPPSGFETAAPGLDIQYPTIMLLLQYFHCIFQWYFVFSFEKKIIFSC